MASLYLSRKLNIDDIMQLNKCILMTKSNVNSIVAANVQIIAGFMRNILFGR